MPSFQLKIAGRGASEPQTLEFESSDNAGALNRLDRLAPGQRAELWRDDDFVCIISSDAGGSGVWKIEGR
ncbi:hypothetical protein J2X37_002059 [Croceicoccus sp. BE223]|nr:hypothetical protein [Croceicoccus sp. BE223]